MGAQFPFSHFAQGVLPEACSLRTRFPLTAIILSTPARAVYAQVAIDTCVACSIPSIPTAFYLVIYDFCSSYTWVDSAVWGPSQSHRTTVQNGDTHSLQHATGCCAMPRIACTSGTLAEQQQQQYITAQQLAASPSRDLASQQHRIDNSRFLLNISRALVCTRAMRT